MIGLNERISNLSIDLDKEIREALEDADKKGKLSVVAAVSGIAGGEDTLREIINSTGELSIMDRGMLGMFLELAQF